MKNEKLTTKNGKRKKVFVLIAGCYLVFMVAATLMVPVKGTVHRSNTAHSDPDAYTELGYYPIWELSEGKAGTDADSLGTGVTIILNTTSWIMQYLFITLVFASLFYRAHRHFS